MNKNTHPVKTLLVVAFLGSSLCSSFLLADPGIFRCGEPGNQSWSQIPCEESSEPVVIEDHRMISETPASREAGDSQDDAEAARAGEDDSVNNVQAFINQLDSQRTEQLAEIDRNILELENSPAAAGEDTDDDSAVDETSSDTAEMIAELKESRRAIIIEYDAMISAAEQRMDTH